MTFTGVTPYLYYEDAAAALDWMTEKLGFGPDTRYEGLDGRVEEAEIRVGPSARVLLTGRAPGAEEGGGAMLIVHVDDIEAQFARITGAGVEMEPPKDEPYGPRTIHVTDPWGYRWYFWEGDAMPPS